MFGPKEPDAVGDEVSGKYGWSALSGADESLFRRYISKHAPPFSYEQNWAYITQQTRLHGMKNLSRRVLSAALIKDPTSPFAFLLAPIGEEAEVLKQLPTLAKGLAGTSGRRVVLRKAPVEWEDKLRQGGFRKILPEAFTLAADYPEDVYPQVVLETDVSARMHLPRLEKVRRRLSHFNRTYNAQLATLSSEQAGDLKRLVDQWAAEHNERSLGGDRGARADAAAYHVLIDAFAHRVDGETYFGLILFVAGVPVGFCFAERCGARSAALYASLAMLEIGGASEFMLVGFMDQLAQAGVRSINLGGSETGGLYRFKKKFDPITEIATVELEYRPR